MFQEALDYVKERKQFNKSIAENQAIQSNWQTWRVNSPVCVYSL